MSLRTFIGRECRFRVQRPFQVHEPYESSAGDRTFGPPGSGPAPTRVRGGPCPACLPASVCWNQCRQRGSGWSRLRKLSRSRRPAFSRGRDHRSLDRPDRLGGRTQARQQAGRERTRSASTPWGAGGDCPSQVVSSSGGSLDPVWVHCSHDIGDYRDCFAPLGPAQSLVKAADGWYLALKSRQVSQRFAHAQVTGESRANSGIRAVSSAIA